MISTPILFSKVLILVFMMLPGTLLKKFKMVDEHFGKSLSNFVLYVATPGMIINAFYRDFDMAVLKKSLIVFAFCVFFHLVFFVISILVFRKKKNWAEGGPEDLKNRVLRFGTIFTNAGYMGIPLIDNLLGSEAAIYASFYVVCFNILVWTFGCFTFTGDKSFISLKKAFLNPAVISIMFGLVIYITPLNKILPSFFADTITSLNALVAPLSMVVIGLHLLEIDWKGLYRDFSLILYIVVRMFFIPCVCFGILKISQLLGYFDNTTFTVLFICASTPCASVTAMFPEKFGGDAVYGSKMVCVTTLLSAVTMPTVALLLSLF